MGDRWAEDIHLLKLLMGYDWYVHEHIYEIIDKITYRFQQNMARVVER